MILRRDFYDRPTLDVARDLIGKLLVHRAGRTPTAGVIVEVEAYIGEDDPACHAAAGRTARNAPLYGPPGRAYVYLNYGLHHLVNAVTEAEGRPAAVLIRALDPVEGLAAMRRRRARQPWRQGRPMVANHELCRGPGNLSCAMGISLGDNARTLSRHPLTIEDGGVRITNVAWGPRIGISDGCDRMWRCIAANHSAVSRSRREPGTGSREP
jgi:DNA-3-methyladenine glycosylase